MLQGYWQSAIAAKPSAAHTGYLMGGLMWFSIPFTLATTMGIAALALDLPITVAEAGQGMFPLSRLMALLNTFPEKGTDLVLVPADCRPFTQHIKSCTVRTTYSLV